MTTTSSTAQPESAAPERDSYDPIEAIGPNPDMWFWEATALTRHVHATAQASSLQPWALLVHVLINISARVPHNYVLPKLFNNYAPINLFALFVGGSGTGKDATRGAAANTVVFCEPLRVGDRVIPGTEADPPAEFAVGSAEGIPKVFRYYVPGKAATKTEPATPGEVKWKRHAAIISMDESDSLDNIAKNSPDLFNQLKQGWSGGALGYSYSNTEKSVIVPAMQYRMNMRVSGQPRHLGAFLQRSTDGFLQRWLWVPTVLDMWRIPYASKMPDVPEPMVWYGMNHPAPTPGEIIPFRVPQWFLDQIVQERIEESVDLFADRIDGHRSQLIERVACILAAADGGRIDVSDLDIRMATKVVEVGEELRSEIVDGMAKVAQNKRHRDSVESAEDEFTRAEALQMRQVEADAQIVAKVVTAVRAAGSSGSTYRNAVHGLSAPQRLRAPGLIDQMVAAGSMRSWKATAANGRSVVYLAEVRE